MAEFKNVFIQWYNKDWNPSQEEQLEYIRKCGLNVIFAHFFYKKGFEVGKKLNLMFKED